MFSETSAYNCVCPEFRTQPSAKD